LSRDADAVRDRTVEQYDYRRTMVLRSAGRNEIGSAQISVKGLWVVYLQVGVVRVGGRSRTLGGEILLMMRAS
jgi:hypothetical protein